MRALLGTLLLALALGMSTGCDPRQVNACDARNVGNQTCIDLQVTGPANALDLLGVAVQGDWVGYSQTAQPQNQPFQLPVALAVALPPTFQGTVRVTVTAFSASVELSVGSVIVAGLTPGEHRSVGLLLTMPADMATPGLRD